MRNESFVNGEFYHIYNRGVDKRDIAAERADIERFFRSMAEFNTLEPIGSLFEKTVIDKRTTEKFGSLASKDRLVHFIAYCLNHNHYHLILQQLENRGIEKFMQRLGTGYTKYFNGKYNRSGSLFQGPFKAIHIDSNDYLLHLSVYVNLNNYIHRLDRFGSLASKSSWEEYIDNRKVGFCEKNIILEQFKNAQEYKEFAENSIIDIAERKQRFFELKELLLEA